MADRRDDPDGESRAAEPSGPAAGLGQRLRDAREAQGMSLRELARRIEVSASLVSQIETEKVQPSVATLFAIVTELGVSMDDMLFGPDNVPAANGAVNGARSPEPVVQRADDRDVATLGSGVRWERLAPTDPSGAEFLYVVYEPGAESSAEGTFQRHAGREWSVVLRGTLHVSVAFDEYVLEAGDSITYDSTVPHRLANHGDEPVHALWFQLGELPEGPAD